jgi:hypothetical protein
VHDGQFDLFRLVRLTDMLIAEPAVLTFRIPDPRVLSSLINGAGLPRINDGSIRLPLNQRTSNVHPGLNES